MVWTTYGVILTVFAFLELIESENLFNAVFMDTNGNKYKADGWIVA